MNFNTMSDEAKTLIHAKLTECVNAFGGASHFYQLLEAIRAAKPNPLLAKNCVFHFELGTVKWGKAIFEDKLNLLTKARLHEGKNNNLLPKENDQAYKRVLNLVRALKPIEFKVKPKNIKHGEGFTVMPLEVIDETTTRMDPIFDILFFAGIDTAKKILKYNPTKQEEPTCHSQN